MRDLQTELGRAERDGDAVENIDDLQEAIDEIEDLQEAIRDKCKGHQHKNYRGWSL